MASLHFILIRVLGQVVLYSGSPCPYAGRPNTFLFLTAFALSISSEL